MSQLFTWGGQSIGVSASASIIPMNTQGWFPLEWTGWIFLQSKGLSRVFYNTTVQKHQFFGTSQFRKVKNSEDGWWWDLHCITMWIYLWPLNCTVTYGQNSIFHICNPYHNKKRTFKNPPPKISKPISTLKKKIVPCVYFSGYHINE